MNIFKKKQSYKVIKLHKIVNIEQGKNIRIHDIIGCCLELFYSTQLSYPNDYEINYGQKEWKTKKSFDNGISKIKEFDISDFAATFSESLSYLSIGNDILNVDESSIPDKSMVSVEIALPSSSIDIDKMTSFFKDLYAFFQYEYGYVVELTEDFSFTTERKIKKKLFGHEVSVEKIDKIWQFHSVGINHGYLKKVYSINILNKSHSIQPIISQCLADKIGSLKQVNNNLSLWLLNDHELNHVKDRFKKSKYLIADKESTDYFMETEEAKRFHEMMKFK
ncbi:hypothetical protein [Flavivirga rizhaonensis]|uniref:Uncharacterized protein n=1 Tax=Flavivirga rizhaonensis TaxID=2559571 RepID=A0A4S1DX94_9FLAO|nr:hypothetical protein [Flavivirga rizhaonensis]TGV02132.1 hypothetical protein EM932_12250 [Flavivirga rizhaonensis]